MGYQELAILPGKHPSKMETDVELAPFLGIFMVKAHSMMAEIGDRFPSEIVDILERPRVCSATHHSREKLH
jgi:hypothetical protein